MTVFFQHVGEAGGGAHFPLTLGTPRGGLKRFRFEDIADDLQELRDDEKRLFQQELIASGENTFQIWGIPSGAAFVIKNLVAGDYLLLLETVGPGGTFAYGGRILARAPRECFVLSGKLWGEARYPVIVLMKGVFTSYRWYDFCDALGYKRTYNPRGQTQRVPPDKLATSAYGDETTLVSRILGSDLDTDARRPTTEEPFMDPAQLDIEAEEGRRWLLAHLRLAGC